MSSNSICGLICAVLSLIAVAVASPVRAQTVEYEVLLDLDRDAASGCALAPTGGAPVPGIEARLVASVDSGQLQVVALEAERCVNGSFSAPIAVPGITLPYPVALNTGINGGDGVELTASRSLLDADRASLVELTFAAADNGGSDTLAAVDGAGGGPILFGLPVQIPTLSIVGLALLIGALLAFAWMAHRRMGRIGTMMAVMLVATAAWAMNFAADGDLLDWSGTGPLARDQLDDATNGSAATDIVAGFAALGGDDLFFRIDVADLENQAPLANDDAYNVDEDGSLSEAAPGVLGNDTDGDLDPLTATLVIGPSSAQAFNLNADGSFDYTPDPDFNGSDSFSYIANDGQADSDAALVTIIVDPVNDPPAAVDDTAATDEDTPVDIDVLANDSDVDGSLDPASVTVTTAPSGGTAGVNPANGVITYTKAPDFNGPDSFVYEVCDNGTPLPAECATATVNLTINDVNDAPSFTAGSDPAVNEDAGAQTVAGWATAISAGPANEAGQVLTFTFTGNTDPSLFAAGPAVDPTTGDLTYTPAADASGSADLTLVLSDDGGTANGGVDTSAPANFSITVDPVNDAPSFTAGADVTVAEDSGAYDQPWATGISAGPADESGQVLTFDITANDNAALFSVGPAIDATTGNLSFTLAADAFGTANLTIDLSDDGGTANGGVDTSPSFNLVIAASGVNDAPTFVAGPDQAVDEDSGAQTVIAWASGIDAGAPNEAGQALSFNITGNTNASLFSAGPSVDAVTGNLSYTPAVDANGSATITIALTDDGGIANGGVDTSTPATFTITVNPINDPPAVTGAPTAQAALGNVGIAVPAAQGLLASVSVTDPDGAAGEPFSVSGGPGAGVTVFSSANGGDVTITDSATGTYTYNPPAGFEGSDSFDYVVCDAGEPAPGECSAPVTAEISVSGVIWFVDAGGGAGGDGRLGTPFNDLGAGASSFDVNAVDSPGDTVFLASGGYQGGLTLLDNQNLIGQGATGTLAAAAGLTVPPNSASLPALGGTRPSVTSAAAGIDLGSGNTLRGFDIGDAVVGLSGNAFGSLSVSEMRIFGTGQALDLVTGTASVALDSIASSNSPAGGLVLDSVSGSFTVSGLTSIDNAAGIGIHLINVPGGFSFGDVLIVNRNAAGIYIEGASGDAFTREFGTVTINNPNPSNTFAFGIDDTTAGGTIEVAGVQIDNGGFNGSALALFNNAGAVDIQGGSVGNSTGVTVRFAAGSGNHTLAAGIANTVGISVQMLNNSSGTISISGDVNDQGDGIFLANNPGASMVFSGELDLSTGAGNAFDASGGGTVSATNADSRITTTTGTAVRIASVDIGAAGFIARSVTSSGGTDAGIVLTNTGGAGAFEITGDGTSSNNASGGTISGKSGNAIELNGTGPVTFSQMLIGASGALSNIGEIGIRAESVNGLTVRNSDFINASGDDAGGGNDFAAIRVRSPVASSDITLVDNLFRRSFEDHVRIENGNGISGGGAVLGTISVNGNDFDDNDASSQGNDALLYVGDNDSDATIEVVGNTFFNSDGDHVQIALNGTASADVTVGGPGFGDGNIMTSSGLGNVLGSGVTMSSGVGAGGAPFSGTLTYMIQGNDIQDAVAAAINVNLSASSTSGALYAGTIDSNTVGARGDPFSGGFGVRVNQNGDGTLNATVRNNTIFQYDGDHGALLQARDGSGRLNVEFTNNTVAEPADAFVFDGLGINAGATGTDTSIVCADVQNNSLSGASGASSGGADFAVFTTSGAPAGPTVILPGYAGGAKDAAAVVSFVQGQNGGSPSGLASFSPNSVGVLGTGTSCL